MNCPAEIVRSRLARYLYHEPLSRPYVRWQLEQFLPHLGQRILEIGCGVGGVLDLLGERELLFGIDVEEDSLRYAAERFSGRPAFGFARIDVTEDRPEKLAELKALRFDSIVCINVLEHIRDDIAALQKMEEILQPGGKLVLLVPAHSCLYGSGDRIDGHYRRYSKAFLRTILKQTRFSLLDMHYFNLVGAVGWWIFYRLLKREIHEEGQFGIMNRLLPVLRLLERVVRVPFGLSLVAICQKPAVSF